MKFFALAGLCALCGCAYLRSTTTTEPTVMLSTNGLPTTIAYHSKTTVRGYTFFDSQSALAKFQNRGNPSSGGEWPAGTSIGTLNQASSSTNLNDLIGTVVNSAVAGAVKGAKTP